jgi:hypothetical protein
MGSVPRVVAEVKTSNAVSKLVKMPGRDVAEPSGNTLYEKLAEKAADRVYGEEFVRARSQEGKLAILKAYAQLPEAYVNHSEWLAGAIRALTSGTMRVDQRKKPLDPVKSAVAKIKAKSPKIPHLKICSKLDAMNIRLPERWRSLTNRTWTGAYSDEKIKRRLKPYFSKV